MLVFDRIRQQSQVTRRCYDDFYIADAGRPADLRTIRLDKAGVLRRHVENGVRAVYDALPSEIKVELAYIPDQMILDFLLLKVGSMQGASTTLHVLSGVGNHP